MILVMVYSISVRPIFDMVHIYKHALSDSEVQSAYVSESGATNSPLVLDIPIAGSVVDVSSNHFTVTTNNGGMFVPDRFGKQTDSAFALNGVNQNLSIPYDAADVPWLSLP